MLNKIVRTRESVLIVADDPSPYQGLAAVHEELNGPVHFCGKSDDFFSLLESLKIRTVILDTGPESEAADFELLKIIKIFDPLIEVFAAGDLHPSEIVIDWIKRGAADFLPKPLPPQALCSALERSESWRCRRSETHRLEKRLDKKFVFQGMLSKSPDMFEVFSLIERIAGHFSMVLVSGETGTGKELVARAIHSLSPVRKMKLVVCDCVSIPEGLFESELFGHVRGAFTGADRNKKGLFEEADGGLLFLDEIGEIPLSIQAKLLRLIETREFRPVGAAETRSAEVRIVAATNRDLRAEVDRGAFREDLFHRLNRIEIHLPPLRTRPEDIPLLSRFFLDKGSAKFGKRVRGFSRQAQKKLLSHSWPGNVRELLNVVESALLTCRKEFIDVPDLPECLKADPAGAVGSPFFSRAAGYTLEDLESEYIAYLMRMNNNNILRTAKVLNISRSTLYRKLVKHNLVFSKLEARCFRPFASNPSGAGKMPA